MDALLDILRKIMPLSSFIIAVAAFAGLVIYAFQLAVGPLEVQVNNHIPSQISDLKENFKELKADVQGLRVDVQELKVDVRELKANAKERDRKIDEILRIVRQNN